MDSIILSLKVVFPLFIYMLLGYIIKNIRIVSKETLSEMNRVVFRIFLPVTLFLNISGSNLVEDFNFSFLLYTIIIVFIMFITLCLIIPRIENDSKKASVMIQGIYRSNFVLFGLSVTASICGADNMGMATIMVAVVVPIFNVLAVVLFEMFRGTKTNIMNVLKGVITNPLIIGSLLGLATLLLNITIPDLVMIPLESIGNVATPLALIILGGTFKFSGLKKYTKQIIITTLGRLVIVPMIFISIAILLGYSGSNLVALMVLLASPTAVSSYSMADQMGADGDLAGYIVVITSVCAIITIFAWTYVLSIFRLI